MKTFSKLLIASALVVIFAAPSFASAVGTEAQTLAERNVYANPPAGNWAGAYAMQTPMRAHQADKAAWQAEFAGTEAQTLAERNVYTHPRSGNL